MNCRRTLLSYRWTIFYVPDVAATLTFYENALGLARRFIADDASYGELETGSTRIGFAANHMAKAAFPGGVQLLEFAGKPQAAELGFATDDVTGAYNAAIAAGAIAVSEPAEKPWGQTVAYVRDLNGILVEFGTDI